jgi:putative membrane protein
MGAADVVPGVSGGTVALVFGIYERLVAQVRRGASFVSHTVRLDKPGAIAAFRSIEWAWLIALVGGAGLAVVTLASWLSTQIDERPEFVSAVFFGLVAASIVVTWRLLDQRDPVRLSVLIGTAVAAFFLLGFRTGAVEDPSAPLLVAAGSVAVCAFILPGISGSFILLMFGLYDFVLDAVEHRDFGVVIPVGVGAIVGILAFSTLLSWLLERHRATVLAALIGLMAGSLRVLWPWPAGDEGLENVSLGPPIDGQLVGCLAGAIAAALIVLAISAFAQRAEDRAVVSPNSGGV